MSYWSAIALLCWRNSIRLLLTLLAVALVTLLLTWSSNSDLPFDGCVLNGDIVSCESTRQGYSAHVRLVPNASRRVQPSVLCHTRTSALNFPDIGSSAKAVT